MCPLFPRTGQAQKLPALGMETLQPLHTAPSLFPSLLLSRPDGLWRLAQGGQAPLGNTAMKGLGSKLKEP